MNAVVCCQTSLVLHKKRAYRIFLNFRFSAIPDLIQQDLAFIQSATSSTFRTQATMPEQYFIIQLYNCYCHRYDTPEDECFDIHDDNVETIHDMYDKEIEELQKRLQDRDLRRWYFEKKKDTEYLLMWCKEEREARI